MRKEWKLEVVCAAAFSLAGLVAAQEDFERVDPPAQIKTEPPKDAAKPQPPPRKKPGEIKNAQKLREMRERLNDEESAELKKLRGENKEAFQAEFKKKMAEMRERQEKDNLKMKEMGEAYRKASSKEEKDKIRAEMKKTLAEEFARRMDANKKHIEEVEKRMKELKDKFEERKKKSDEIIERRLDELTRDPVLNW